MDKDISAKLEGIDKKLDEIIALFTKSLISKDCAVSQINNLLKEKPELRNDLRNCLEIIAQCYHTDSQISHELYWFINNLSF